MSRDLSGLGLRREDWRFLDSPDVYVQAYGEAHPEGTRPLLPAPTRRQFRTARAILERFQTQQGVLLADDVGLGKTTVAALVACVFAGRDRRVRVLAPSAVMERRWKEEIRSHLEPLMATTRRLHLGATFRTIRGDVQRLDRGKIAVTTHMKGKRLACDLLIVDEVHRARGENSRVARRLRRQRQNYGRVLFLTATPFSIDPKGLRRMLSLVGGRAAAGPSRAYSRLLDQLWQGQIGADPDRFAGRLAEAGRAAADAIRPFVIRHSVETLTKDEQKFFGRVCKWPIDGGDAGPEALAYLLHLDRLLILGKKSGAWKKTRTNDPRYHVGWARARGDLQTMAAELEGEPEDATAAAARLHLDRATRYEAKLGQHPKVAATVAAVREVVQRCEKVVVYCEHHASAQEVARELHRALPLPRNATEPHHVPWRNAWRRLLAEEGGLAEAGNRAAQKPLETFLDWLCARGMRHQVASWMNAPPQDEAGLAAAFRDQSARHSKYARPIAAEAILLYRAFTAPESHSTRAILQRGSAKKVPGGGGTATAVVAACERPEDLRRAEEDLFFPGEPDIVMAVFNSPFGPDVLVATDRLSEGIDLHGYCRHVVHHELDPSTIRTIQRNWRVRRVNSWAARSGRPIRIAYPAFRGTRDERLVELMRQRLLQFDLLLGGVRDSIDLEAPDATAIHEQILKRIGGRLRRVDLSIDPA